MSDLAVTTQGWGPPVVLVHGFTQTGRSWGRVAADLGRDHTVTCVEVAGHGGSSAVRADLVQGAELLGAAGGQATYIGYSMGGRLGLHLALTRPDLVTALVVLGATGGLEDPAERQARRAADELLAQRIEGDGVARFLNFWLAQPLFAGLPDDPAERADRLTNTADGLASSLRLTGTGTQRPLWDDLGSLAMPVLVLAGERDHKFTALGQRLARGIGPNATFDTIAGAGHASHLEAPQLFVDRLRRWWTDQAPSHSPRA
jgi:2-succinyl-6-hydroxy-2,4-cyclohexadiene-1-carboxylate synthase